MLSRAFGELLGVAVAFGVPQEVSGNLRQCSRQALNRRSVLLAIGSDSVILIAHLMCAHNAIRARCLPQRVMLLRE